MGPTSCIASPPPPSPPSPHHKDVAACLPSWHYMYNEHHPMPESPRSPPGRRPSEPCRFASVWHDLGCAVLELVQIGGVAVHEYRDRDAVASGQYVDETSSRGIFGGNVEENHSRALLLLEMEKLDCRHADAFSPTRPEDKLATETGLGCGFCHRVRSRVSRIAISGLDLRLLKVSTVGKTI